MQEEFVALRVAAGLEGLCYSTLRDRILHHEDDYVIQRRPREGGGRPEVFISVSSLSPAAQQRYRQQKKKEAAAACDAGAPWYVDTEPGWFVQVYRKEYMEAADKVSLLAPILDAGRGEKGELVSRAAQALEVSEREVYRLTKRLLEARAWAKAKEEESGMTRSFQHFLIMSLCRAPVERQTFPSLPEEQKTLIKCIWFDKGFAQNLNSKEQLYRLFSERAAALGWTIPSQKTVARYINYIMQQPEAINAHYLAAHGERAFKNKMLHKGLRDTKSLQVMEFVQGDAHTFDCFVEYTDSSGRKSAIRPVLVAWMDTRSRCVMGQIICKTSSAEVIQQSIIKMIYSEIGGVPKELHIDNGKDFTAERNTGQKRSERSMSFDALKNGLFHELGIECYSRARPYEPWSKGEIERFFRTVCEQFTKLFASYTGTLTGSKTICKRPKDIQRMLERGELLTLEEFAQAFDRYLDQYHHRKHRGLKDAGEEFTTPLEVFRNAERYERANIIPDPELAKIALLPMETATVYNHGIRRFNTEYSDDALEAYVGQRVNIRYNPEDLRVLHVYAQDGHKICDAYDKARLAFGDEEQAAEHIRSQNRRLAAVRSNLEAFTGPDAYREQLEEKARSKSESMVGCMDLDSMTIRKKRAESSVIAFPDDKEFREDKRIKREEQDKAKAFAEIGFIRAMNEDLMKNIAAAQRDE